MTLFFFSQEMGYDYAQQKFSPYDYEDEKNTGLYFIALCITVGVILLGLFIWFLYVCMKKSRQPN
jgi:heme/copper-type cytochrome/quinol oxidase subunit 2